MARQKYGLKLVETSRILNEKTGSRPVCSVKGLCVSGSASLLCDLYMSVCGAFFTGLAGRNGQSDACKDNQEGDVTHCIYDY